jgi:hypothetical protein
MIIKNTGGIPGLALGRCKVIGVSHRQLLELLWHEDLFVLWIVSGPELH